MTIPDFVADSELDAAQLNVLVDALNEIPTQFGLPAARITTASNGTTTSGATETRDAVLGNYAFTADGTTRYRAMLLGRMPFGNSTSLGDRYLINIRDGGGSTPTAASPLVAQLAVVLLGAGFAAAPTTPVIGTFLPGAGTRTLSAFFLRVSGTGTVTPASPSAACEFYCEAIGEL